MTTPAFALSAMSSWLRREPVTMIVAGWPGTADGSGRLALSTGTGAVLDWHRAGLSSAVSDQSQTDFLVEPCVFVAAAECRRLRCRSLGRSNLSGLSEPVPKTAADNYGGPLPDRRIVIQLRALSDLSDNCAPAVAVAAHAEPHSAETQEHKRPSGRLRDC